jgi:putative MATE family efflux protein
VLSQWAAAAAYVVVVMRFVSRLGISVAPVWSGIASGFRASAPLLLRTVSLRAVLVVSAAVAARFGSEQLAAHQLAIVVWSTLGLGLDAVAIAGQALVGRYLGAGDRHQARIATRRMVEWSIGSGLLFLVLIALVHDVLPSLFTDDQAVRDHMAGVLLIIALLQPLAGWAFALDGVLIGAGDARYLAAAQALTFLVFLPLAAIVLRLDLGITALWWALGGWMLSRVVVLVYRERGEAWAVVGATR